MWTPRRTGSPPSAANGRFWRRVVPSPEPRAIVELGTRRLRGADAVVDKDRAAALLAEGLGADALLMLTDVSAVEAGYWTPSSRVLTDVGLTELRELSFAPGSMGPKVDAACRFVEATGGRAAIGSLAQIQQIVDGEAGTQVVAKKEET
jgi:carbamate kinase